MVKSLWLVISTLALANILAILGVVGWLRMTDRLSAERVEEVREIFSSTVASESKEAREAEAEASREKTIEERIEEGKGSAPIASEARNRIINERDEIAQQRVQRAEREAQDLLRTATQRLRELESREAAFEQKVASWEAMRERLTEQESTEQFKKAVRNYESQSPDVARDMLDALIDRDETEQVVAYLDAMQARKSAKVIDAFAEDDAALAAELLEKLRTFGIEPPEPEQSTDDDAVQPDLAANP